MNSTNLILKVNIDYNNFNESYQENYLDKINKEDIREQLDIPKSDKLKKNGTFKRKLYFNTGTSLQCKIVKIQTLLWIKASGKQVYISVFPSCIIKYNNTSTDLIEFITVNLKENQDIFSLIDDPQNLLECEDTLLKSCNKVNIAVEKNCLSALLHAKYTTIYNQIIKANAFKEFMKDTLKFKNIFYLLEIAKICFKHSLIQGDSLSNLNLIFNFLR